MVRGRVCSSSKSLQRMCLFDSVQSQPRCASNLAACKQKMDKFDEVLNSQVFVRMEGNTHL